MSTPNEIAKDLLETINVDKPKMKFFPSYDNERSAQFRVTNPSDKTISVKIKSTRLKQLFTKPAHVHIKPKRGIYIKVIFKKLLGDFDCQSDRLTVYFGIVPADKEALKPSAFWKTAAPEVTRRFVLEIEYEPKIEGSPPPGAPSVAPTPATGAPKKEEDDEGEEGEDDEE